MSDRLSAILRKARHTLTDKQSGRYSDIVLLDHLDDAQKKIVLSTHSLTTSVTANIVDGVSLYTAPEDSLSLTRISIDGAKVTPSTFTLMDKLGSWENLTGTRVEKVLTEDNLPFQFRFYPIPKDPSVPTYTLLYSRMPTAITRVSDTLEIPMLFDAILVYYIVFKALYSNADSANRLMATEQLALYTAGLADIKSIASKNFTFAQNVNTNYSTF